MSIAGTPRWANDPTQAKEITSYGEEPRFLDQVHMFFDKAAKFTHATPELLNFIKQCHTIVRFNIPIIRDSGEIEVVKCYRAHHSLHKLPAKGGIRFTPNVDVSEVEAISGLMTYKLAVLEIPMGGAIGAISIDPSQYSQKELQKITRRFTLELAKKGFIGAAIDVPGIDLGTDQQIMTWMMDTYQMVYGNEDINSEAAVTGKFLGRGGIAGSVESTGLGIYYGIRHMLANEEFTKKSKLDTGLNGKTVIIQGYGNVGQHLAQYLCKDGAIIVGIITEDVGIYDEGGLDIEKVQNWQKEHNTLLNFKDCQKIGNHKFYYDICKL